MKTEFDRQLNQLLGAQKERKLLMTDDRYKELLVETKEAYDRRRNGGHLSGIHYRRLKRFDVTTIGADERLMYNNDKGQRSSKTYFCMASEMFDVLHEAHLKIDHKKEKAMELELKKTYCNITREVIAIYLNLCEKCSSKKKTKPNEVMGNPPSVKDDQRCQISIIDMEKQPDGEYKYILVYQDDVTRFLILRPLKGKNSKEMADALYDIFSLIGIPNTMVCNMDRIYTQEIRKILADNWNVSLERLDCNNFSTNQVSKDIQKSLMEWMLEKQSHTWASSLRVIQSSKNQQLHPAIQCTPQEAMFGNALISSTCHDSDDSVKLQSEELFKERLALLKKKLDEVDAIRKEIIETHEATAQMSLHLEDSKGGLKKSTTKRRAPKRQLGARKLMKTHLNSSPTTFNVGDRVMVSISDNDSFLKPKRLRHRKDSATKTAILERLFHRNQCHVTGSISRDYYPAKTIKSTGKFKNPKLNGLSK